MREGGHRVGSLGGDKAETGKRYVKQQLLPRAQRVAAGAAIQPLRRGFHALQCYRPKALFSAGTRSVFSHVNVPNTGSGVRPKWP